MYRVESRKYDPAAINAIGVNRPHFLAKTKDSEIIFRENEGNGFTMIFNDQNDRVNLSKEDSKNLALWILSFK